MKRSKWALLLAALLCIVQAVMPMTVFAFTAQTPTRVPEIGEVVTVYTKADMVLDFSSYNAAAEKDFDSHVFRPVRTDYAYLSREVRHTLAKYLKGEETLEKAAAVMEELVNNIK